MALLPQRLSSLYSGVLGGREVNGGGEPEVVELRLCSRPGRGSEVLGAAEWEFWMDFLFTLAAGGQSVRLVLEKSGGCQHTIQIKSRWLQKLKAHFDGGRNVIHGLGKSLPGCGGKEEFSLFL